jgi:type II secretory pathway predicted ATPase ExeA
MEAPHFGLRQRPFPTTPDSSVYYPATTHEQALHRLLQGLHQEEGILLLTGEPGTGKTLLCHCLLQRLEANCPSILLTNSHLRDRVSLLQALLFDLSLPYEGRSEQEMRLALTGHLLESFSQGRRTVVLIDEAQHLSADLLEELRLLGNLEARSGKALQIVLVGLPSLLQTLAQPGLRALAQRLAVQASIERLDVQEAADYLLHHLRVAGGQAEEIFSTEALQMLAQASGGVPRLLNQLGRHALALAAMAGADQVDIEAALEVLARFGLETPEGPSAEAPMVTPDLTLPENAFEPDTEDPQRSVLTFSPDDPTSQLFMAPKRPA